MLAIAAFVGAIVATFLASPDFLYMVLSLSVLTGLVGVGVRYISELTRLLTDIARSAEENGRAIDGEMRKLQSAREMAVLR